MESTVSAYGSSSIFSQRFIDRGTSVDPKKIEKSFSESPLTSLKNSKSGTRSAHAHQIKKTNNESRSDITRATEDSCKTVRSNARSTARPRLISSCRLILSVVSSLGLLNLYTLRFNMSVAMTWMVDRTSLLESELMSNKTTKLSHPTCKIPTRVINITSMNEQNLKIIMRLPKGEFFWSKDIQNTIKSSFYWGYVLTQIPGGWLAESKRPIRQPLMWFYRCVLFCVIFFTQYQGLCKQWHSFFTLSFEIDHQNKYGGKRFIGFAILTCGIGNLLIPTVARQGYRFLIALRVLLGIAQGVVWPSMFVIWARWAPSGSFLGIVITFPGVVILAERESLGWPSVFYVSGICGIVWTLAWYRFAYDTPLIHPRISEQEKNYIHRNLRKTITQQLKNQPPTPWKALLTSVPVWVLVACHTCNDFTLYFLIDSLFHYMTTVLAYNESLARFINTIPYIFCFVISVFTGVIYDRVTTRRICSPTAARKIGNTIGTVVPAFLVLAAGFMDCDRGVYGIILVVASTSMCGFQYGAGFTNVYLDIAPQHTGMTFGIANTVSIVAGVSEPFVLSSITKDNLLSQWRNLFTILAVLFLLEAAIFDLFGTAKIQEWALPPSEEKRNSQHNNTSGDHLQQLRSTTLQSGVKLGY